MGSGPELQRQQTRDQETMPDTRLSQSGGQRQVQELPQEV